MNLLAPIKSIMSQNLITATAEDTVAHVEALFAEHRIHHIPVVNGSELVGIVSKSDINLMKRTKSDSELGKKLQEIKLQHYQVKDIMTVGVAVLESTDKINVALEVFMANLFHAIPIVDDGKLVGIVTTFDIIKNIVKDQEVHLSYT